MPTSPGDAVRVDLALYQAQAGEANRTGLELQANMPNPGGLVKKIGSGIRQKVLKKIGLREDHRLRRAYAVKGLFEISARCGEDRL